MPVRVVPCTRVGNIFLLNADHLVAGSGLRPAVEHDSVKIALLEKKEVSLRLAQLVAS